MCDAGELQHIVRWFCLGGTDISAKVFQSSEQELPRWRRENSCSYWSCSHLNYGYKFSHKLTHPSYGFFTPLPPEDGPGRAHLRAASHTRLSGSWKPPAQTPCQSPSLELYTIYKTSFLSLSLKVMFRLSSSAPTTCCTPTDSHRSWWRRLQSVLVRGQQRPKHICFFKVEKIIRHKDKHPRVLGAFRWEKKQQQQQRIPNFYRYHCRAALMHEHPMLCCWEDAIVKLQS